MRRCQIAPRSSCNYSDGDFVVVLVDALDVVRFVSRVEVGLHRHGDWALNKSLGIISVPVLDPLQVALSSVQGIVVILLGIKLAVSAAAISTVPMITLHVIILWADLSTTTVLAVWAIATFRATESKDQAKVCYPEESSNNAEDSTSPVHVCIVILTDLAWGVSLVAVEFGMTGTASEIGT